MGSADYHELTKLIPLALPLVSASERRKKKKKLF
jgi:hypothetical protein